ncbi:alpha/beta fold hydrolase [Paenarthrobacter nicotinovorans]|uniref:alpha/beta fold hydrolase n=1 Tax=Paenarthrobacter nicotinovorans TaxID=29320 RepID=UPI003810CDB4
MHDHTRSTSLDLKNYRSFYVGSEPVRVSGEKIEHYTFAEGGVPVAINPNGTYRTGGMYVQEFRQKSPRSSVPVLFMHGGSMTGAVWEHTPDGRDGWLQYFLQAGFDCYNVDAVERGRSGWNPRDPHFQQHPILRTAEDCFHQFRLGHSIKDTAATSLRKAAYPGLQFPLQHFQQFAEGIVPRWTLTNSIILSAYRQLLEKIGPVILCAHSQGAAFAFQLAEQRPDLVKSIVALEPAKAGDGDGSAFQQISVLNIYGDYIDLDARWPSIRNDTDSFFDKASTHGADITLVDLPREGITGNSHLLLVERNNAAIADIAIDWINNN